MAKIQVVALNLFLVCIKYSSLPTLLTTYWRLAPSLSRSNADVTYAQSHNRRLNTKRHIESSVHRLFSGDSCILVPCVNFTNKAPPIIKNTNKHSRTSRRHIYHHIPPSSINHDNPPSHHANGHFSTSNEYYFIGPPPSFHQRPRPSSNVQRLSRLPLLRSTPSILLLWCLQVTPALSTSFVATDK
jgi:hypothetical protein